MPAGDGRGWDGGRIGAVEKSEDKLIRWIASRQASGVRDAQIGIGDDMAMLPFPAGGMLVASDMLMDGVHFDTSVHAPEQIGRKALAVNLSDCAAMAVRPRFAVVSVALPDAWTMEQAQSLFVGMEGLAKAYDCAIVGGDTNSWPRPLVVDVAVVAEPWEGVKPVRRDGMQVGDAVYVTGRLGGSLCLRGHHLTFEPRVREACVLARCLGSGLHAMMDLSDGLSTDARRMTVASGCGIEFDAAALRGVVSEAALAASREDGRGPLEHVFDDGEDFELLFAVDARAEWRTAEGATVTLSCPCTRVGVAIEEEGVWLREGDGRRVAVKAGGWEHWTAETSKRRNAKM